MNIQSTTGATTPGVAAGARREGFSSAIAGNTVLNLVGMVAPALAALFALPVLNRFLGTERVGFLTLAWALIGYFSLFDLGIGRALTKLVAEKIGCSDTTNLSRVIWTALALMLGLGIIACVVMATAARWIVESGLRIPVELRREAVIAVRILALTLPLVVTSAGLRGLLEAQGRFLVSNAVRGPLGIWLIAGPLLLIPFHVQSLALVAAILLVGRLGAWGAYAVACIRGTPALRGSVSCGRADVWPLLRFGGWMTISNIISPLMVYMDRFLIGNRVSLQAVAWYATPFEVVTKILIIPGAAVSVLFPFFSSLAADNSAEAARVYRLSVKSMAILLFMPTFVTSLFAIEGLRLWLGDPFATHSAQVVQLLAFGVLLNAVATVPFALLQGFGRPDLTAKIHLVELPIYSLSVIWLTNRFGITGTAVAWTARMVLDLATLDFLTRRTLRLKHVPSLPTLALALTGMALFSSTLLPMTMLAKLPLLAVVLVCESFLVYNIVLEHKSLQRLRIALHPRTPIP